MWNFPKEGDGKYLGIHIDRRLAWHKHIFTKQNPLQATNFSYIKQYTNQSGLEEYNSVVRLPFSK
jgi:hypothetical protein